MTTAQKGHPQNHNQSRLPFWLKLVYGSGEFGFASVGLMRSLFFAIYLTDVVGLNPQLASFGALVGIIWDAINDPLVGIASDRVRSRFGRRRLFLLLFAIPFGSSFVFLWSAPGWDSQTALIVYVTISFMLADTLSTLVSVPYLALTPELTQDYDERTSLSVYRTVFQLVGSLALVITAPMVIDLLLESGYTQQAGFMVTGAIFGTLGALAIILIFVFVKEDPKPKETISPTMIESLQTAWRNIPFRFISGIFLLNWSALDMMAVILPYFLLYWFADGNLLAKANIFGLDLALESAFFGVLMVACILTMPFWLWLAKKRSKREAYVLGTVVFLIVELLIFTIMPGQMTKLLVVGAFAGFGIGAAYILPDAIFPDIIEWDELRTGRRQEGIYYGAKAFIRKLTGALVIFITLQLLGLSNYQNPPPDVIQFSQPESALTMIRVLISIAGAGMLSIAAILGWVYPLTREKHNRIRRLLAQKNDRQKLD